MTRKTLIIILCFGIFVNQGWAENTMNSSPNLKEAIFAGGCFWCMEPPYDALDGVLKTTSGYSGGKERDPSYQQVASGRTSHLEVIQVTYDPTKVSYKKLLEVFWRNIDPTDGSGQFCDKGDQYTSAIFYGDQAEKETAEQSLDALKQRVAFGDQIVTRILPAGPFYPAEEYHQDYYKKNPVRYKFYRYSCGRDKRLKQLWE